MKLITLVVCAALTTAGAAFGQIGLTVKQCTAKYGAAIGREPQEWHKVKSEHYYLEIHFYKDKADAVSYLNLDRRRPAIHRKSNPGTAKAMFGHEVGSRR